MEQCSARNAKLQRSDTFCIADGDELYISSIDKSNVNTQEWILNECGKLIVRYIMGVWNVLFTAITYRSLTFVILNIGEYFVI